MRYDVVVVGAGAIGNNVAYLLAKKGFKVAVIERKERIGYPLKCAGLVSERVLKLANAKETVQNELYGAFIHSPNGNVLDIESESVKAFAIDRGKLDNVLAKRAMDCNADYFLKTEFVGIDRKNDFLEIKAKGERKVFHCKLIIGADGARSKVRKILDLPPPSEILACVGAEVERVSLDPKKVHVFLGKDIAPGFFAWIIPTSMDGSKARIGLCLKIPPPKPLKTYFDFLFTHPISGKMLKGCRITNFIRGLIPIGLLEKSTADSAMIVGDASSQVKPLSGGGLYFGLLSSKHCSAVASLALEKGDLSDKFLAWYHKMWRRDLQREISIGLKIRKKFLKMSDGDIDRYLGYLNDEKVLSIIERYGDIDYPSRLIFPIIRHLPKLLPNVLSLLF